MSLYAGFAVKQMKPPSYQRDALTFDGWRHGLHVVDHQQATQVKPTELAECVNFHIHNQAGHLKSRAAISKYTNAAAASSAAVKAFKKVLIGATEYELLIDANYKIYYLDGSLDPTLIGTLEGDATILPYNGVALLLDGSFIKYLDGVSKIKIAYDDGTGSSGYQFNNLNGSDDTTLALGNGTNTRIAVKFTSQAWTAGYTIPPTTVTVELSAQGTPSASAITIRIRRVSNGSVMAAKDLMADASELTSVSEQVSVTFTESDITTELSPNVAYYFSIEHTGGDSSNYVKVHCTTVASGGTAYYYDGSWHADATKTPIAALRPGMPPKGAFGTVALGRPFVAGDPDNPGWLWFGNLTHLDWSTADGGGYVGAVDGNANSFPIGGVENIYEDVLVYGKENHPYVARLTGGEPSSYSLPVTFQKVWTNHRCLISVVNDMWSASRDGVYPISGVQAYGDLRASRVDDPIMKRIEDYWDTDTALAAYYPTDGQFWLVMPDWHRVLVARIKYPVVEPNGEGFRYPWCEFEFYRDRLVRSAYKWTESAAAAGEFYLEAAAGGDPGIAEPDFITVDNVKWPEGTAGSLSAGSWDYGDNDSLGYNTVYIKMAESEGGGSADPDDYTHDIRVIMVPTCFAYHEGAFFMGGSDGFVYKLDGDEYKDLGTHQIIPRMRTAYIYLPFKHNEFEYYQIFGSSYTGAEITIAIYRNGRTVTPFHTFVHELLISDSITVGDALMDLGDADFSLGGDQLATMWKEKHFNARSVQFGVQDVALAGYPLHIDGMIWLRRHLSA